MSTELWTAAATALRLLAVDPLGLGGALLRARSGPARDAWRRAVRGALAPLELHRIAPSVDDRQLSGGIDLAATLAAGRPVWTQGLLSGDPVALILPMAERAPLDLAAKLGAALDDRRCALIALDEGAEPEEAAPAALADRLAFQLVLDGVSAAQTAPIDLDANEIAAARAALPTVAAPGEAMRDLTVLAAKLGIVSLRAPILALRVARAAAALAGRTAVDQDDLALAAQLTLAPRATTLPAPEPEQPEPEQPEPEQPEAPEERSSEEDEAQTLEAPSELLLDAVRAALPEGLLDQLIATNALRGAGRGTSRQGARRKGAERGRPLPSRRGRLGGGARIDVAETLRAAAPWQPLRRRGGDGDAWRVLVRPDDIRVRRREERSERILVFAVDASGSAAMARLAEVKGAVETLLASAYARRDHVALIAFRGTGAQLLLPPTRSLTRAKRQLAGLPGGGATPLAAGLAAALTQVEAARRRGASPSLMVLTDGRANLALDGQPDRARATEDAGRAAAQLRACGAPAMVVDAANRPQQAARRLAEEMGAEYLPLPRADAGRLSKAASAVLTAGERG